MKKKLLTMIVCSMTVLLVGCGNSVVKKSIAESKSFMENKEYDKAIISLEIALDEDKENAEANKLYKIIDSYQKAKKNLDENNIIDAKKILDSIDKEYEKYSIKEDVYNLKKDLKKYDTEKEKIDKYLAEAEKLFNETKYSSCKSYLIDNILGDETKGTSANKYATEEQKQKAQELLDKCKAEEAKILQEEEKKKQAKAMKDKYIKKLNDVEAGLSDLDYLRESVFGIDMLEAAGREFKRWDDMLNEIYKLLKTQLSKSEMDDLTQKQLAWLDYRETTAKNAGADMGPSTGASLQYTSVSAQLTKERCYELVNNYMK